MKKLKKPISFIMAVLLAAASFPALAVNASAVSTEPGNKKNGLTIEVTTSKAEYAYGDTAEIKVTVTNGYGFDIDNLMISVYSADCKLPNGEKCKSDVRQLKRNGKTEFKVNTKLGTNKKLSFFQKILFFFRNLFSRDSSFEKINDTDKSSVSINSKNRIFEDKAQKSVVFGPSECKFDVTVIYDCGYTDEMQKRADNVDKEIKEKLESDEFKKALNIDISSESKSAEEQKAEIKETLDNLAEEKLIKEPEFDQEECVYWFKYNLGEGQDAIGGVRLTVSKDDEEEKNSYGPLNTPQGVPGGTDAEGVLLLNGFGRKSSYDKIQQDYNKYYGTAFKNAEYESCRNLDNRSILCFSCHGYVYFGNLPYIQLPNFPDDEMFKEELKDKNAGSIFDVVINYIGEIAADISAQSFGVLFPAFFKSKNINNSVVFLESCCAFGNGEKSNKLAQSFLDAGAIAVIGFQNEVYSSYSRNFLMSFINSFACGATVGEAFNASKSALGATDGDVGKPCLLGNTNATILNCGPDTEKTAGLRIHYTETTTGHNGEGDLPVMIISKDEVKGKSNDEIAEIARAKIIGDEMKLFNGATITSVKKTGDMYYINALVAN